MACKDLHGQTTAHLSRHLPTSNQACILLFLECSPSPCNLQSCHFCYLEWFSISPFSCGCLPLILQISSEVVLPPIGLPSLMTLYKQRPCLLYFLLSENQWLPHSQMHLGCQCSYTNDLPRLGFNFLISEGVLDYHIDLYFSYNHQRI